MKKALISVSDKTGLDLLGRFLIEQNFEIISTGGTKKFLDERGFKTKDVSELTGFPEVLGGRVKTLHPYVHMSILAKSTDEHQQVLKKHNLNNFDLVVCNLYPFEKAALDLNGTDISDELIEEIDIGGVTLLRAAAKNFHQVVILCDPSDYSSYIDKKTELTILDRKKLALKAFQQTSFYDSLISSAFARDLQHSQGYATSASIGTTETPFFPTTLIVPYKLYQPLRYGENPHQKAAWYQNPLDNGLQSMKQLSGKELSFNNILDLQSCWELVQSFSKPVCIAVKHNNPCGVGSNQLPLKALENGLIADPVSVFGGIICTNFLVDLSMAKKLGEIFLECILAPEFSEDAIQFLSQKKNLRLLQNESVARSSQRFQSQSMKFVEGGLLVQQADQKFESKNWIYHGEKPSETVLQDLIFAEKVCAQLKS
ncbi:MAG: bifunctional phosphoribosylaminoimidazolecarboxamide formyltransferase/IMP cyclohydrolase, partial [Pseudobdellovibrionaceae bacterium]